MLRSLKELGIPDYSEQEWINLDINQRFIDLLLIENLGEDIRKKKIPYKSEEMGRDIKLYIDLINYLKPKPKIEEKTKKIVKEESRIWNFKLYNKWEEDFEKVNTYNEFFDFLKRLNAAELLFRNIGTGIFYSIYAISSSFAVHGRFNYYFEEGIDNAVKRLNSEKDRHLSRKYIDEVINNLYFLKTLIDEKPLDITIYKIGWEQERAVYPYYAALKKENKIKII